MPYALIPEGFTLKKVTKAEEDAVKEYRRHDDFKTFLDNETTPLLIGGTMAVAFTPLLWALFFKAVQEAGVTVTDVQKGVILGGLPAVLGSDNILGGVLGAGAPSKKSLQRIWNVIVKGEGSLNPK